MSQLSDPNATRRPPQEETGRLLELASRIDAAEPAALLTLWTETRSIGAALAFAAVAPSDDTSLPTGRSARAHNAWVACADRRERAALPALLEAATSGTADQAAARLSRLDEVEDPRIELALLRYLTEMSFRTAPSCEAFWGVVFRRLTHRGPVDADFAAIAATCRTIGTNFAMTHARRVERLAKRVAAASRALTDDERDQLLERGFLATEDEEEDGPPIEALFEAVYADPADLGARTVLADALLSREDPRGEFIALQLALSTPAHTTQSRGRTYTPFGHRDTAHPRLEELLAQHANAWLGPWVAVICEVEWRNGFPHTVSIEHKRAKTGKLAGEPALRTTQRIELLPRMWTDNQRGGLRKALRSDVFGNVRSISKLFPSDLKPIRKARAATLVDLTIVLHHAIEAADLEALGKELENWTALASLTLEVLPSLVQQEMPSLTALMRQLAIASITWEVEAGDGQAMALDALVAAAHPATQQISVVPSYGTRLHTEREDCRFTRATYRIDPPDEWPRRLVLGAWARAQQAFELTVDGPQDVVTAQAEDLRFLPLLRGDVATLAALEVHGPIEAGHLAFDRPVPEIRELTLHSPDIDVATLAAVERSSVEELLLQAGWLMRIRRGESGRLDHCQLDWPRWRERGTEFEMLQRLAPSFRTIDWERGERPAELDAFLEGR